MVGEIRDAETATIAVRAALTGHRVLSTVHTNDAAGAFTRFMDMGIEPFLVASVMLVSIAQRLVRRVCSYCKKPYSPSESALATWGFDGVVGMASYTGTRYSTATTRDTKVTGIYEVLVVDEEVQDMILKRRCRTGNHQDSQRKRETQNPQGRCRR